MRGVGEFARGVTHQIAERRGTFAEVGLYVAGLLGDPRPIGVAGGAEDVDVALRSTPSSPTQESRS